VRTTRVYCRKRKSDFELDLKRSQVEFELTLTPFQKRAYPMTEKTGPQSRSCVSATSRKVNEFEGKIERKRFAAHRKHF